MNRQSKTNWDRIDALHDEDIDYSDSPRLGSDFFRKAVQWPGNKEPISLRIDRDVLAFFRGQGRGYQTAINTLLRKYVETQKQEGMSLTRRDRRAKGVEAELLERRRYRAEDIPRANDAGIYACFLSRGAPLRGVAVKPSHLLYVGMGSKLDARNHFTYSNSGSSTLRRSLGAILKEELNLHAVRRGKGASTTNVRNYRFRDADEKRLTAWMIAHMEYSAVAVTKDIEAIESRLIQELRPPLNIKGLPKCERQFLLDLRKICSDEAHKGR